VDPDETKQSYLKLSRLAAFTNGICQDLMATTTTEKFGTTGHNLGTANLDNIIFLGSLYSANVYDNNSDTKLPDGSWVPGNITITPTYQLPKHPDILRRRFA
jgi:hypothetical protein